MKQTNKKNMQLTGIILSAILGAACGGGGGSGDPTPGPAPNTAPVAEAGTDLTVSRNFTVNLDGGASSDADDDPLTFTWTQTAGPDVTGGAGTLSGEAPAFGAPGDVGTIMFELVVNDGQDDSAPDTMMINVLEDVNVAYFVDADNGSDLDGNGSSATPFASIAKALCEVTADQQDIYVMTRADSQVYDETTDPCPGGQTRSADQILAIPTGTSLYGGYGTNWVRDASANPTMVDTSIHGFRFTDVNINAWFSGFDVHTADAPNPDNNVYAIYAVGGSATLHVADNTLTAGNVGFGTAANPGSSHGLLVALIEGSIIERNVITAGFGGDGMDVGNIFTGEAADGSPGGDATSNGGAAGGDGKGSEDRDGGAGGSAGTGLNSNGNRGTNGQTSGSGGGSGGAGGSGNSHDNGSSGGTGDPGISGSGGARGNGTGTITAFQDGGNFAYFAQGNGNTGNRGTAGHGGGGGGGGEATWDGYNGGGGGGGGGGGAGGTGGPGGTGGGASIGLFIAAVNSSSITENVIYSGLGGIGATGGQGQAGGDGGVYGSGAAGNCDLFKCGGSGGRGGSGGKGGTGGRGGAGGGGPSYGIAIGDNIAPSISNNDVISGEGGQGGFGGSNGHGGNGGNSYAVFDNNINDGIIPTLINNSLTFGLPGNGGETTTSTGGSVGGVGQSGTKNW